jgi:hypothetical protein
MVDTSSATTPDALQNQLSWQSAFFGLMGILFAVLLQNAGNTPYLGSMEEFYALTPGLRELNRISFRSFPVVCATDTLLMLVEFVFLSFSYGPGTAAKYVWHERFKNAPIEEPRTHHYRGQLELGDQMLYDITSSQEPPTGVRRGSGIDSSYRWSMVAFFFLTVTQTTKLLACQGIPVTKTITALYLATFIVPECFRLSAGPAPSVQPDHPYREITQPFKLCTFLYQHYQQVIMVLATFAQIVLWIWTVSLYLDDIVSEGVKEFFQAFNSWFIFIAVFIITIGVFYLIIFGALSWLFNRNDFLQQIMDTTLGEPSIKNLFWNAVAQSIFYFALGLLGYFSWYCGFSFGPTGGATILISTTLIFGIAHGLKIIYFALLGFRKSSQKLRRLLGLRGTASNGEYYQIFGLLLNFISIYVYYSTVYRSQNTFKPSWTEKLG